MMPTTMMPMTRMATPTTTTATMTTAITRTATGRLLIAVDLHDNDAVLPDLILQLRQLVEFYGRDRTVVSVYESGSTDQSKLQLRMFEYLLRGLGVEHRIKMEEVARGPHDHRIDYLARVRNQAMEPLYSAEPSTFDRVLFLNDVFHCFHDMLELLYQSVGHRHRSSSSRGLMMNGD